MVLRFDFSSVEMLYSLVLWGGYNIVKMKKYASRLSAIATYAFTPYRSTDNGEGLKMEICQNKTVNSYRRPRRY